MSLYAFNKIQEEIVIRNLLLVMAGFVMLSVAGSLFAADVDLKGAIPGKWTMDLEAVGRLANEKKLPVLLNFSGSDWCSWCRTMNENVFSRQEWEDYAKDNILMVVIDFPEDSTIVPQRYVERNNELKARYMVDGFPSYVVLDDDAKTELGRFGVGEEDTPTSFIAELEKLFRYRPADIDRYSRTLNPEDRSEYLAMVNQIVKCDKAIKIYNQQLKIAKQRVEKLEQKVTELKSSAQGFRAARLGADSHKQYLKLKTDLERTEKEMEDWFSTEPQHSEENTKKYQTMSTTIRDLSEKLSRY